MSLIQSIHQEFSPDLLPAILAQLTEEEAVELEAHLEADERDSIIRRCSERVVAHDRGPMYWLRKITTTENFQWQAQGLQPKEPFPYKPYTPGEWDYLDWVMSFVLAEAELYIPKTREMMSSWLVAGYITWMCQFFPSTGWIAQSETDLKAQGLIKYANILYDNQPDWMRSRFPLKRGDTGTMHKIEWATGSWFRAVPQGERQLASDHPYGYFNDESAHQPAWEATKDIAKPAVRQSIHVSSAAPSRFFDLCDAGSAV
jgi:hypothetical protein